MKAKYYMKLQNGHLQVIEHDSKDDGFSPEQVIEFAKEEYKVERVLYVVEELC